MWEVIGQPQGHLKEVGSRVDENFSNAISSFWLCLFVKFLSHQKIHAFKQLELGWSPQSPGLNLGALQWLRMENWRWEIERCKKPL